MIRKRTAEFFPIRGVVRGISWSNLPKASGMQILRVGNVPAGLHEMQNKDCLSFVRKRTVCVCACVWIGNC